MCLQPRSSCCFFSNLRGSAQWLGALSCLLHVAVTIYSAHFVTNVLPRSLHQKEGGINETNVGLACAIAPNLVSILSLLLMIWGVSRDQRLLLVPCLLTTLVEVILVTALIIILVWPLADKDCGLGSKGWRLNILDEERLEQGITFAFLAGILALKISLWFILMFVFRLIRAKQGAKDNGVDCVTITVDSPPPPSYGELPPGYWCSVMDKQQPMHPGGHSRWHTQPYGYHGQEDLLQLQNISDITHPLAASG